MTSDTASLRLHRKPVAAIALDYGGYAVTSRENHRTDQLDTVAAILAAVALQVREDGTHVGSDAERARPASRINAKGKVS